MQRKVGRSACEFPNSLDHSFAVWRNLRSDFTQAIGKRLARRRDDMRAAKQRDLNGGESRHGSTTVDHEGLASSQREEVDAASCGLDRHRKRGSLSDIQSLWDRQKNLEDGILGGSEGWVAQIIGDAEDQITDVDIRNFFADCVYGSGNIEPDSSRRRSGQEALTHGPIRGIDCAGMDTHADLAGTRIGNSNIVQTQYVKRLAVGFETKCFHRGGLGLVMEFSVLDNSGLQLELSVTDT